MGSASVCHLNTLTEGNACYLNLDLDTFCGDMIKAVRKWYDSSKNDAHVAANIDDVMRVRDMGVISGVLAIY